MEIGCHPTQLTFHFMLNVVYLNVLLLICVKSSFTISFDITGVQCKFNVLNRVLYKFKYEAKSFLILIILNLNLVLKSAMIYQIVFDRSKYIVHSGWFWSYLIFLVLYHSNWWDGCFTLKTSSNACNYIWLKLLKKNIRITLTDRGVFEKEGVFIILIKDETEGHTASDGSVLDRRFIRSAQYQRTGVIVLFDGDVVASAVNHSKSIISIIKINRICLK